jgi:hypothetical protein
LSKARRKRVTFTATKKTPRTKRVSFVTSDGRRISFTATEMVNKKENVSFYTNRKRK